MSDSPTLGWLIAAFLERCSVGTAFGVISIHNMPILDAIGTRGAIRFVPSRGEAGAVNMADAYARVSGQLGVAFTSTGTAAGNAAGAMVEAQTAGTPLLHITGQIESAYIDRDMAYIHEAQDQLGMLKAVSKAAFRVRSPETGLATIKEAVRCALTPPTGPVSVEIPIDFQEADVPIPADLDPLPVVAPEPGGPALDRLADALSTTRRPLLWLGGGARHAAGPGARLVDLGFAAVTSTNGRGVLPEDHPMSLGAFTMQPPVEDFYATCDAVVVAGSRLRGNETLKYRLGLPRPHYRIDADALAEGRSYDCDLFLRADAAMALAGLADRLENRLAPDPLFADDVARTRREAERRLRKGLGPYSELVDAIQDAVPRDFVWVRDVTISNSTWGNRYLRVFGPRAGVHAVGGGIGQGVPMAVGAAVAAQGRRTVCLVGDGGLQLNLGEIATAVQERADVLFVVMNSRGYGVIKNIQDARYGGRHYFVDLTCPDLAALCAAVGMPHRRLDRLDGAGPTVAEALHAGGASMIEIDMTAIGDFAEPFAGPPVRRKVAETAES